MNRHKRAALGTQRRAKARQRQAERLADLARRRQPSPGAIYANALLDGSRDPAIERLMAHGGMVNSPAGPISSTEFEDQVASGLLAAGVEPWFVAAFRKTKLYITNTNFSVFSEHERAAWREAVAVELVGTPNDDNEKGGVV